MPELPEVETIVRQLRPLLIGRRVDRFEVFDARLALKSPGRARDRRVAKVERIGKRIAVELAPGSPHNHLKSPAKSLFLLIHLRMTGRLIFGDKADQAPAPPLRARLVLDQGALLFNDVRRFGTMELVERAGETPGLDPFSPAFNARGLAALLAGSRTEIKPWLLRQDKLVGIGNIYASEALYLAGIHPRRAAGSLARAEIGGLARSIRAVLRRAIAAGGTTFNDFQNARGEIGTYQHNLQVYDHAGERCPRCAAPLARIVQQQRSTFFCPKCQR